MNQQSLQSHSPARPSRRLPVLEDQQDRAAASTVIQVAAQMEQLVCRYCGSADLAPSFTKRRDARCCACFKQRCPSTAVPHGSATGPKKTTRILKTKIAK